MSKQADNIATLYAFEQNIPPVVEAVIESQLTVGDASVEAMRGIGALTTPRIEVDLVMRKPFSQIFTYKGGQYLVAYLAKLVCTVVTERDENTDAHGLLLGQLRLFMQQGERRLSSDNLGYYSFRSIIEAGSQPTLQDKDNTDKTAVAFDCVIEILQDSFPA